MWGYEAIKICFLKLKFWRQNICRQYRSHACLEGNTTYRCAGEVAAEHGARGTVVCRSGYSCLWIWCLLDRASL